MQVQAANTGVFLLQESFALFYPALATPSLATGQCGWQLRHEMRTLRALREAFRACLQGNKQKGPGAEPELFLKRI